jgi:hypothetical protein
MTDILGINHIVDSIERSSKTNVTAVATSYNRTVDSGRDVIYVALSDFFQIVDDTRTDISSFFTLFLYIMAAGAFVGTLLLGDKIILVLQSMPRLFESLSLVKL